jgi:delta8-fatty-acid desaturase
MMGRYRIGRVEDPWINCVPPIQGRGLLKVDTLDNETTDAGYLLLDSLSAGKIHPGQILKRNKLPATPPLTPPSLLEKCEDPAAPTYIEAETKKQTSLDIDKYPRLDSVIQADIMDKYRELDAKIRAEGLYQCNYWAYLSDASRCCALLLLSIMFLRWEWYIMSAVGLGHFWHQLVFVVHDAGHMGITHNYHIDTLIGMSLANFIGGLSLSWWKDNHNIHHIVTNAPEHDPDIEHLPFFAISHRFFASLRSTYYDRIMHYTPFARFMMHYQSYLYYVILAFGRFNLYVLSWNYLLFAPTPRSIRWHRYFEIIGELVFWYWFGYLILYCYVPTWSSRVCFILVSHMINMPLHVQLTVSHFAMSTADLGPSESFPQKMLRTTMDVDCPPWLDFIHGGLQFQAIHHLFPRLPRYSLRRAQRLVKEFCKETGIPYALYGFVEGNEKVIGRLGEVSRQAAILVKCQETMVREAEISGNLS